MRFKYNSYEKLFPRQEIQQPDQYETVVESFTPSKDGTQDAPAAPTPAAAAPTPEPIAPPIMPPITPAPEPIQEGNLDGHTDTN